jgi:predicted DNA-binding transcriptional regulator AlpA
MINIIKNLLLKIVDDIDADNTNISEEDQKTIIDVIKNLTDKTKTVNKYKACNLLRVSRATFDNYIRAGKLPKGIKEAGSTELRWEIKTLEDFINKTKPKRKF